MRLYSVSVQCVGCNCGACLGEKVRSTEGGLKGVDVFGWSKRKCEQKYWRLGGEGIK